MFPGLKEQGYHITFYTGTIGEAVTKFDPHIDRCVMQTDDAVPNEQLGRFWRALEKKYDKFVNLCETVERTFLAMKGNINFIWPHHMRHKYLNANYLEFVHDMAGVPLPPRIKFYPAPEEAQWAREEHARVGSKVALWVLSGSAIHKVWPYLDIVIERVLRKTDARFVLIGDEQCKKLEEGWEDNPRVYCRSGKWSVRETLAFAQVADLVIGPETGVLNAVSMEPMPKIVMLSHSSVENLTRDWVNTVSLYSSTECYPCHRLHMVVDGFKDCVESKSIPGIAACQADLLPGVVEDSILKVLE